MNLLTLLPGALRAVAKVTGLDIVGKAADALTNVPESPELRAALLEHEQEMKRLSIEELKVALSENLAMIGSADKFVARARPTQVYLAGFITAAIAVAMIFGAKLDTGAILTIIGPLWGNAAFYTHNRTREKMNGGT